MAEEEEVVAAAPVEEEENIDSLEAANRKVAKLLEADKVKVCYLAESCNEPAYKKLVQATSIVQHKMDEYSLLLSNAGNLRVRTSVVAGFVLGEECATARCRRQQDSW
eukprot:3375866-Amphidinium_carterae.2